MDAGHGAGDRGARIRNAALMGMEDLAAREREPHRLGDEVGRRAVALADPERDQPLAVAAIVEDLDDAALGDLARWAFNESTSTSCAGTAGA